MKVRGSGYRWIKGKSYKGLKAEQKKLNKQLTKARLKAQVKRQKVELFRLNHPNIVGLEKSFSKKTKKALRGWTF